MIDLRTLGAVEVRADRPGGGSALVTQPKRLALLLYLVLAEPSGLHSRDRLLALLWPDADEASSRHSLRNGLHSLRRALGEAALVTRGDAFVGVDFGVLRCDALELRAHLAAGRVEEAAALWRGELAPGFHVSGAPDFEHWLDRQRDDLRSAMRAAAWKRAAELKGSGAAELGAVQQAARLDPANEPGARRLMQLLASSGDRVGALRAYQALADHLARELDTVPSAETRTLVASLRASHPTPPAAPAPSAPAPMVEPAPPAAVEPMAAPEPAVATAAVPARLRSFRTVTAGAFVLAALAGATFVAGRSPPPPPVPWFTSDPSTPQGEAERAVLRLPARYRADSSAYRSYLRGLTLRFQFKFMASRDTLAALVDREPLYVPGIYGLAHTYVFLALNELTEPSETWPKVDALARRAVALDSSAAKAWLALASEEMFRHLDLARADTLIARARRLDSLDPDAAGMRSTWFRFHGRMDSAVAYAQLAHRLDPLSVYFDRQVGKQLFFARRYEESRRVYARLLTEDPNWSRGYTDAVELYRAMGRPREAVEWLRRARAAAGDSAGAAALPPPATDDEAWAQLAQDARRTLDELERAVRAGKPARASRFAVAHAILRDTSATFRWLDAMATRRDSYLAQVRMDPVFDFLRDDARYADWERRSGLPPRDP